MSIVTKNYTESLLDEILLRYLHNNQTPSTTTILDVYESLTTQYPLLGSKPYLWLLDVDFLRHEHMRSDRINAVWRRAVKDISILYKTVFDLVEEINTSSQNWNLYYQSVDKRLRGLENQVDNLLLLKQDTLGYFNYVQDNFDTTTLTNTAATTALVNTDHGIVTLPKLPTTTSTVYSKVKVNPSSVTLTYKTLHPSLISSSLGVGVEDIDLISGSNKPWYVVANTKQPNGSLLVTLQLDLGEKLDINTVVLNTYQVNRSDGLIITLFYSEKGIDWIKAGSAPTQTITRSGTWNFSNVNVRFLRFLITKTHYDSINADGTYQWTLGASSIELYKSVYMSSEVDTTSAEFKSIVHVFRLSNLTFTDQGFNKVLLETCEQLPPGTDIKYFVKADESGYIPISPKDRKNSAYPPIVNFGNEQTVDTIDAALPIDNSYPVRTAFSDSTSIAIEQDYRSDVGFVNILVDDDVLDNMVLNSSVVYRNVGVRNSDLTVRGSYQGWKTEETDSNSISTNILVRNSEGVTIDIGPSGATIDGSRVSGVVTLLPGIHKFTTTISQWRPIEPGLSTDSEVKLVDTLWPYNHKLLVEGYDYGETNYQGMYVGFDLWCEIVCFYLPYSEFINSTRFDVFTYEQSSPNLVFIVKIDSSFTDYVNEIFDISYRLRNQTFTELTLKAILSTRDSNYSPILSEYILKVG